MKKQQGFTLPELFLIIATLVTLTMFGGIAYVAFHFIQKFW